MLSGLVRAWVHTSNNCVGGTSQGYGFLSKLPGTGRVSLMSDDILAKNYGLYSTAVSFALPRKFKNGQTWTAWVGEDGVTFFEGGSGIIKNAGTCRKPATSHGRKTTLDGLKEIIAAHRKAKAG